MPREQTRRRKFSFVLYKACDEQTRPWNYDTLKDQFVQNALPPELTKSLVFVFVFVLAHAQAISSTQRTSLSVFVCLGES